MKRESSAIRGAHRLETLVRIERPRDDVFAFFADAENLQRITPPELHFGILTPPPIAIYEGARIRYSLRLFGVPFEWDTVIERWDPPYRFVDRQVRGPYRQWIHLHEFEAEGGATIMRDRVDWALPLWPVGEIARPLVRRQLDRIFSYRRDTILQL